MKVSMPTVTPNVLVNEPRMFDDARDFRLEIFNKNAFYEAIDQDLKFGFGAGIELTEDNHKRCTAWTDRGHGNDQMAVMTPQLAGNDHTSLDPAEAEIFD